MLQRFSPSLPDVARHTLAWVRRRPAPVVGIGAAALALLVIALWGSRGLGETSLFSVALHPAQANEVEHALTIWNEPFTATTDHSAILVPVARRRDILLRLTLAGLPHGYVPTTADVLEDNSDLLLSPGVAEDRRRAGIQGDLVAGLRRLAGVVDATVVIAPPAADILSGAGAGSPSASVQLLLQPGARLTALQVAGIARYVAASYPGLTAEHVAIVDGSGLLQAAADQPPDISRELRLQNSIQTALDAVLGPGSAVVRVSIRTLSRTNVTQVTRTIPHGLLQSESARESGREHDRSYQRERDSRRYAYDTVVEHRGSGDDAGARVAIAVFLDEAKAAAVTVAALDDLVRAAAGADLGAGDRVVVKALRFRVVDEQRPADGAPSHTLAALPFAFAGGLMLAGGLAAAWRQLRSSAAQRVERAPAALADIVGQEAPATAAYLLRSMPAPLRQRILAHYDPAYRQRIEGHLNGSIHGAC